MAILSCYEVVLMMRNKKEYKRQARILKAIANETRLMLIDRLSKGECQVGELVRMAGVDQSTVSKHLAVLRGVGVVDDERRGNAVFYRLVTPCVMDFFACSSRVMKGGV
jgi:DNA-binding transcriptional ArsR family regulator